MAGKLVEVKKTAAAPSAPGDSWQSFRREMDRLYDRFSGAWGMPAGVWNFPTWTGLFDREPFRQYETSFGLPAPASDVSEDEKTYKISAELPGMDEKDIEVSVSGDLLVIKGEKRQEHEEKKKNYYLSERSYGSFQRSFHLPEGVDRDKIAADFAKGVLMVTLPKTVEAKKQQKKIDIKAA